MSRLQTRQAIARGTIVRRDFQRAPIRLDRACGVAGAFQQKRQHRRRRGASRLQHRRFGARQNRRVGVANFRQSKRAVEQGLRAHFFGVDCAARGRRCCRAASTRGLQRRGVDWFSRGRCRASRFRRSHRIRRRGRCCCGSRLRVQRRESKRHGNRCRCGRSGTRHRVAARCDRRRCSSA